MKFSEHWLREWVNPEIGCEELAAQLTMAGLEVDAAVPAAPPFEGVVIGHVLSVASHPDADKLRVCSVDAGGGQPLQIVCGAPNVAEGMKAPLAVVGAYLPGGLKIKRAKLRGVESEGMLCSARELGLSDDAAGLMALPADAPTGSDLRVHLDLDDTLIELGLTPNRGDCLGLAGIAREVGVLNRCEAAGPAIEAVPAAVDDTLQVTVEAPAACPRYLGRVLRDIDPQARTPAWMAERLRRSGVRSLGPLVDVTNYVMLELGQPMHAFDLAQIQGGVRVRMAAAGERLTLLDGQELELDAETLVIADAGKALALAGIMGGEHSGVADDTRDLFLECAFFAPGALVGRARRYGLRTDSSHRFERGVDPQLQARAMERATALLLEIAGGRPGPVVEWCAEERLPLRLGILLRRARLSRLLGIEVADATVADILTRLGMEVKETPEGWQVVPPSFRFDLSIEADLVEEVARIHGYAQMPSRLPSGALAGASLPETRIDVERVRQLLVDRDFQEAITYSFVDPEIQQTLAPEFTPVALANPISADLSVMRTTLWGGLLRALGYNRNRQQGRIRLFEIGLSFVSQGTELKQENQVAAVLLGDREPEQWHAKGTAADFYDLKADVEALLALGGCPECFDFVPERHSALHPGQSAAIIRDGEPVGWLGRLHPVVAKRLDLPPSVLLFEVALGAVTASAVPKFAELSKFPAIRRDIAVVLGDEVPARDVLGAVRESAGSLLQELQLFDVYDGEGIENGKKSVALGLILQDRSRTLTDQDVDAVTARILDALTSRFDAVLRD